MQVFVAGTWKPERAAPYREQALLLGSALAAAGLDLACGPGTGIARHVIDGYRSVAPRGSVRYYLPSPEAMAAAGESVADGADEIEETGLDYPMRNVHQVSRSSGLFVLTGGDGALQEILAALIDYRQPVAIVRGAGSAALAVERLLGVYPEWEGQLLLGPDVQALLGPFVERVTGTGR